MDSRDHERDDLGLPYSISYRATSANSAPVIDGRIPAPASQTLDRQQTPPPQYSDPDPFPAANATASNSRAPPQEAAHNHITIPTATAVRYRECQKNHAASSGGHVFDGCGEFMPGGEDGTPEALRCAACDCHRNFHRRESPVAEEHHHLNAFHGGGRHHHPHAATVFRNTPPLITVSHHHHAPPPQHNHHKLSHSSAPMMMAFGGAVAESSSEDLNVFGYTNSGSGGIQGHYSSGSRKRFRTKFSQIQKEKMQEFAEKLGWKIQKQDDTEVQQFCSEVGIKRRVFKVWMHNNKQAMKKKE